MPKPRRRKNNSTLIYEALEKENYSGSQVSSSSRPPERTGDRINLVRKNKTSKAKAKAVRSLVEKSITAAKQNTIASRRRLLARLRNENAVKKLMEQLGPRYAERKGGFTRIITIGNRKGDSSEEAMIELV